MSISQEITRIQNAKASLKTSINAKTDLQHQITDETIDDYADFVDSITTGGSELPDGYTLVSYLESSKTQYINTGYVPNANTKIEIKCLQIDGGGGLAFGTRQPAPGGGDDIYYSLATSSGKITFFYNQRIRLTSNFNTGDFIDLLVEKNKIAFNGVEYTGININTFPTYPIVLFGLNNAGTMSLSSARIGRVKIYENNILIRNFLPCYRNSDNVLGMYDVVNNVFYTNDGTGTFLYTPLYT